MNAITPFHFDGAQVRAMEIDGEPWFVAKDVACVLGYTNPHEAIRTHCKGVSEILTPSAGGPQNTKIIPERDLYRLIMRSKLPAAERFEEWVVGDVLPAIRKTGRYEMPGAPEDERDVHPIPTAEPQPLTRGAVNAWTGYVNMVAKIFDRETAQQQYRKTPLPPLDAEPQVPVAVPAKALDGMACLRHLLAARVSRATLSLGDLVRIARADAATRNGLGDIGVRVDPVNLRGQVAFAASHPRLQRAFADTVWAPDWSVALLALPGAQPAPDLLEGFDRKRRAVLVPWDVVEAALDPARKLDG